MHFRFFINLIPYLLLLLLLSTNSASAVVYSSPVPSTCGDGLFLKVFQSDGYCWFTGEGASVGGLWGKNAWVSPGGGVNLTQEFTETYIPLPGQYRLRLYVCPSTTYGFCTIKNSSEYIESANSVNLNPKETISSQNPNFGGNSGMTRILFSFNICLALVDSSGVIWGTADRVSCEGASPLPTTPSTCFLNNNADLNVDMGSLERSKIAISPASGSVGNVKKIIPVLCTRDAGTTVTTTFQFTSLTVNGNEVISTSIKNLGVAVFYNGKLVGPSSAPITENFEASTTNRELEFQAVRDPNVELKEIPTGNFTASAVMVMTEQ
ncbi:hypothetical protein [Enterobacter cancerogenus]